VALRKLDVLNAAHKLEDLRFLPGKCFKNMKGDLLGFDSVRIKDQWRILFRWENDVADVGIIDYH